MATPAVARSPPETSDGRRAWPPSRPPTVRGGGLRHGRRAGHGCLALHLVRVRCGRGSHDVGASRATNVTRNGAGATKDAPAALAEPRAPFGRSSARPQENG